LLIQARDLFRNYSGDDRTGHAEVLTNLSIALDAMGKTTAAGLALEEAMDILIQTEDYDQLYRVLVTAADMGSNLVDADRVSELIEGCAEEALHAQRLGTAYVRYCKGISIVVKNGGSIEVAQRMIRCARDLENRLAPLEPNVPKLRFLEALVLRLAGEPLTRTISVLIEGAHHWHKRIAAPLVPADFLTAASDLHMHFRTLAGDLIAEGRLEEALAAFDAGRGLGYAVEVDRTIHARMIAQNPFAADGIAVDTTLLRSVQQAMGSDEVGVVLAVIPPRLIAFVVDRDRVDCVAVDVPSTPKDLEKLSSECIMSPQRLAEGVGSRAIPPPVLGLARGIAKAIDTRVVTAFVPYDALHTIPWRAVLRHCGLQWHQLPFALGFHLTLRRRDASKHVVAGRPVIALGCGTAGAVDLQEEASAFAAAFGVFGNTVLGATAAGVRRSLQANAVILLSCHGKSINQIGDLQLELSDGSALIGDVFPVTVSSPLVILSACESGVYSMAWSDFPIGAAPILIRRGAECVICARFPLKAIFAAKYFSSYAQSLAAGSTIGVAFTATLKECDETGADLWRDLACLELIGGV
jgi:hypothetical protein